MRTWLKNSRKGKGITMSKMADLLGISESYYCLIENGERQKRIDISLLVKLSDILQISVIEMIKMEEQREMKK